MAMDIDALIDELYREVVGDADAATAVLAPVTLSPLKPAVMERKEVVINDAEVIEIEAWLCSECSELFEEAGPELYECGGCGEVYNRDNSADGDSHRCPCCNKFGRKLADVSCPECEGSEVTVAEAVSCPACYELVLADEFADHKRDDHGISSDRHLTYGGTHAPRQ